MISQDHINLYRMTHSRRLSLLYITMTYNIPGALEMTARILLTVSMKEDAAALETINRLQTVLDLRPQELHSPYCSI